MGHQPLPQKQSVLLGRDWTCATRRALRNIARMPRSLFELRRARKEKAAPQRSGGGTKEERDDRGMLAIAETHARFKADVSIVPRGADVSFCIISQHFVLGYFH